MKTISAVSDVKAYVGELKKNGKSLGFVPTMGALHEGHLSLIKASKKENDLTIASIFVNPTQFNNPNDLKNYPRVPEKDIQLLEDIACDILFMPEVNEMYPEKDTRTFDFKGLDTYMEGKHREGHFNGVAQIVSKLFDAVQPTRAYFGEKDFQQLAIIKQMTKMLNLPIEIKACQTIRESDGLAMSSRNLLLDNEHRKAANVIYKTLTACAEKKKQMTVDELKKWASDQINSLKIFTVEYLEIANPETLKPLENWEAKEARAFTAVQAGDVRLIDNVKIY